MNNLLTISMITNEALFVLRNNLVAARHINREYNDKFGVEGAKIGQVLSVRKPPRYIVQNGAKMQKQDVKEEQVPVKLDQQKHVAISFTSADLLLSIDEFSERIIKPAVAALANQIDYDVLQMFKKVPNFTGAIGTVPNALSTYLDAGVFLSDEATPKVDRYVVISPRMEATIVNALSGLFHDGKEVTRQYRDGTMGRAAGFDWSMDQNVGAHTVGALGASNPTVTGAGQTGSNLLTGGWAAGATLNEGDIMEIVGVSAINPQNRIATGQRRRFVVTQQCVADAGGVMIIPIYPAIIPVGPNTPDATVDVTAGNGAVINVFGIAAANFATIAGVTSRQGMAFHKDAFTLVSADLPLPEGVDKAARASDPDLGISIRLVRDYNISDDEFPCRLDVLYGVSALRQELACRVLG